MTKITIADSTVDMGLAFDEIPVGRWYTYGGSLHLKISSGSVAILHESGTQIKHVDGQAGTDRGRFLLTPVEFIFERSGPNKQGSD